MSLIDVLIEEAIEYLNLRLYNLVVVSLNNNF